MDPDDTGLEDGGGTKTDLRDDMGMSHCGLCTLLTHEDWSNLQLRIEGDKSMRCKLNISDEIPVQLAEFLPYQIGELCCLCIHIESPVQH